LVGQQIRLLILLPGPFGTSLYVQLENAILAQNSIPDFEALSYTWGSPDQPVNIFINITFLPVRALPITQNLECALQHLRYIDRPRVLWIDAICVNQQDVQERSKQVPRMTDIYSLAKNVLVWVGPESDNSVLALDILRDLSTRFEVDFQGHMLMPPKGITSSQLDRESHWWDTKQTLPYTKVELMPLCHLFGRPWFERLWIQQEIRLAQSSVLMCGFHKLSWPAFRKAAEALWLKAVDDKEIGLLTYGPIFKERRKHVRALCTGGLYRSFEDLLTLTRRCKCTDPRDRVYALLGLLDQKYDIVPNYEKPVTEVYQDMFLAFTKKQRAYGNLKLLAYCEMHDPASDIPSWVPDWSRENKCEPLMTSDGLGATGFSNVDVCLLDNGILRVNGVEVANISVVFPTQLSAESTVNDFTVVLKTILPPSMTHLETFEKRLEILYRTLCCDSFSDVLEDQDSAILPDRREAKMGLRDILRSNWGTKISLSKGIFKYLDYALGYCRYRSIFSTTKGAIGLGPPLAASGDVIVLLPGCFSPMVLRPLQAWHEGLPITRYRVVGECYLQDLMVGKAILGEFPSGYEHVTTFLEDENNFFDAYRYRPSGKIHPEDPRFKRFQTETGEDGIRKVFVRENFDSAETPKIEAGIKMKVSGLDDAEEILAMGIDVQSFELI
jgi:Heterokaryon incompatibility protein (HET)